MSFFIFRNDEKREYEEYRRNQIAEEERLKVTDFKVARFARHKPFLLFQKAVEEARERMWENQRRINDLVRNVNCFTRVTKWQAFFFFAGSNAWMSNQSTTVLGRHQNAQNDAATWITKMNSNIVDQIGQLDLNWLDSSPSISNNPSLTRNKTATIFLK